MCLREVFVFRFMQTDPNWSNFLFNKRTGRVRDFFMSFGCSNLGFLKIELIDFGATRAYSQSFVDQYLGLISAAIDEDDVESVRRSVQLGYLTGDETKVRQLSSCTTLQANEMAIAGNAIGPPYFALRTRHSLPPVFAEPLPFRRLGTAHYRFHTRADPYHAQAPPDATASRDLQPQSQAERRFSSL